MSVNRLKSTTIFGELIVQDISGNNANTVLNRNLSVGGNIKCSNYITSPNLSTPSTSLIDSGFGTFYSNGGTPYFSFNTGSVINSFVIATVNQLSAYLTTANAASTYLTITNAASTYLTGTTAALTYQPITLMGDYLTTITAAATYLTQSSAASIYQTISNMSNYITRGGDIPFNTNIAKLSFLSSFPTTAVNNNNTGIGFFWNHSGGQGETDLVAFGQGGTGGIALYGAGNTYSPSLICRLYSGFIDFSTTPNFPTSNTIGTIGATTQYVDNRLSTVITQGGNIPLNNNAKLSFPSSYPSTAVNNNNAGIGFYWNYSNQYGETDLLCYGKDMMGGLTISTASNTQAPLTLCRFYRDFIGFTFAPQFATNINVGNIAATTQYVDDRLLPYNILNNFTFTPIGSNILYA